MVHMPPDPATGLWQRIPPAELEKFANLLDANPVPIGKVAAELGIDVQSITLPSDISGLIRRVGADQNYQYEIQVNNTDAPVRQRFTVAHEIAHLLLHRNYIDGDGITDSILYRSKLSDKTEAEANRLAAALLLPWERVQRWSEEHCHSKPDTSNLEDIAKAFKVSNLAVGFRFNF